ncbi:MAG: alpha/beta hydrolase [Myxococcales bacterium]|nr:alpha/beta hydrolase [Myxococcales bacterium]
MVAPPIESRVLANGIDHHVLTWDGNGAEGTIVLCHGFLDFAWSFAPFAEALAGLGHRVVAFDWRGHGESSWIGAGGYYHFPDYVLDLAELLPQVVEGPLHLLGHSMGGTAACLYAGTRPKDVTSLCLVEGIGPPGHDPSEAVGRCDTFLRTVAAVRNGRDRILPTLDAAAERLRAQHPRLGEEWARFLAEKGTVAATGPDGNAQGYRWRFDPLHRTTSPITFTDAVFGGFLERICVPVLYIADREGFRPAEEGDRLARLPSHRVLEYGGKGHMIHWFAPRELARDVSNFVRST